MRGCSIGIGIDSVSGGGIPSSIKNKILFLGNYSSISDGKMLNTLGGDYLTVTGSVGSESYQTPNTSDYIAADSEWLWINTSEVLTPVTSANLVAKDFARTFVKYANTSPYAIEKIMILKSTSVIDSEFKDWASKYFLLHAYYFNEYNSNGYIKENRAGYTPYLYTLPALSDGDTKFWFDYNTGVTYDGSNRVADWADALGSGIHVLQTFDDNKPVIDLTGVLDADNVLDDGILSDGSNDTLKSATFTWNQPEFVYVVAKFITWTANDMLFDGYVSHSGKIYQATATPQTFAAAGTASEAISPVLGKWYIFRVYFNGANSKLIMNNGTPITGNFGAANMSGITITCRGTGAASFANAKIKAIIGRVSDTSEADIYNFLKKKYAINWF